MHDDFIRSAFLATALSTLVFGCSRVEILRFLWNWIHVIILHRQHVSFHFPRPRTLSDHIFLRGFRQHSHGIICFHPSHRASVENATFKEEEDRNPEQFFLTASLYVKHTPNITPSKLYEYCNSLRKHLGLASLAWLSMVFRVQQFYNEDTLWMLIPVTTTRYHPFSIESILHSPTHCILKLPLLIYLSSLQFPWNSASASFVAVSL